MNISPRCALHSQEPLDLVCLAPSCELKGLLCYLCKVEHHADHQPLLSLKLLLGEFLEKTAEGQDFVKEVSLIDRELLNIQQKVERLKKKMAAPQLAEEAFQGFWKSILASIVGFDEMTSELKQILRSEGNELVRGLNHWIKNNGDKYSTEKDEQAKDNVYVAFLKGKQRALASVREHFEKLEQRSSFDDNELLAQFAIQLTERSIRLRFSEDLKGSCMTILTPTKASMTVHGNQRMMLLQPQLATSRGIKRWKVKIEKLASWIGVGVAHLDTIKAANFDFSYTSANHGNYLISSNGYSWNGYKMEFNSKLQTFTFTTGDTVELTYDPNGNKVSFKKEGEEAVFTYDVDPSQKPIHAAINMTGVGDAVEIIL